MPKLRKKPNANMTNAAVAALDGRDFTPKPCQTPTNAAPHSAEKIAVLAARFAAGVELWHEDDPAVIYQESSVEIPQKKILPGLPKVLRKF